MSQMHITYGKEKEHQRKLKLGLAQMPVGFLAELCWSCEGLTEYRQLYNEGCGMGTYYSTGPCEYCYGGLKMGNKPAPKSVVNQVLVAAENADVFLPESR